MTQSTFDLVVKKPNENQEVVRCWQSGDDYFGGIWVNGMANVKYIIEIEATFGTDLIHTETAKKDRFFLTALKTKIS